MTGPLGSPTSEPSRRTQTPGWLPKDAEQVRVPDADSVDVDGRSVDAGQTAVRNLEALGHTAKVALLPDRAARAIRTAWSTHPGVARAVGGFLAGLALDALELVKAPFTLVKDGLEVAAWSSVAGARHVRGTDVVAPPAEAGSPPDFQTVGLRSKTQARTGYFHYALKDGKIWTRWDPVLPQGPVVVRCGEPMSAEVADRMLAGASGPYTYRFDPERNEIVATPRPDADQVGFKMVAGRLEPVDREEASAWHLHDGMGGPRLPEGEHAVEMQVAGEYLEIRTNTNKMYCYDPTKPDPVVWKAEEGCPFLGDVHLPEGIRDWTLGEAVQVKPIRACLKSMNPATDIVGYYEDPLGHKGDFGFTATTGVLLGDGRQVRYRDTGLPADFARGFLTPHKGRFLGEKLAQAGGTWLLYGREPDGRPALYTRMYDYEINGDCPGRHYSYEPTPFDPDKVYSLSGQVQTLPTPGWQGIPFPRLQGQAMVTDRIDLLPTGQGNAAREVRLEGRNAAGVTGYYHKGFAEADWRFTETGAPLTGQSVPVGQPDQAMASPQPISLSYPEAEWSGDLGGAPLRGVELVDFHPYQTQDEASVIRFTLESGKTVEALVRTGDGYTPYQTRPEDHDRLGTGVGLPKVLIGTLEVPLTVRESADPEVKAFAEKYLMPLHHKENQLMLLAERDQVQVSADWYYRDSDQRFDWTRNPDFRLTFRRDATGETPYEKRAGDASLRPTGEMSKAELLAAIARNRALETELSADLQGRRSHHMKRWLRARATDTAITAICWTGSALNVTAKVGHAGQISQLMPPLTRAHTQADWQAAHATPEGYTRAVQALRQNVARAQALLAQAR